MTPSVAAQPQGQWLLPFNWGDPVIREPVLNTIHVGVIPRGPQRGKVVILTWDTAARWNILDPEASGTARFITPPNQPTDPAFQLITCVGQGWTSDGRWFVCGGQTGYPGLGTTYAWLYDPEAVQWGGSTYGEWYRQVDMDQRRYYPTVVQTPKDFPLGALILSEMIVAGGSDDTGSTTTPPALYQDNYERFQPPLRNSQQTNAGVWVAYNPNPPVVRPYPGPTHPTGRFLWYPRLFSTADGRMTLVASQGPGVATDQTSFAVHPVASAQNWIPRGIRTLSGQRGYSPALIYPNLSGSFVNAVMNIAGETPNGATTNVEWSDPTLNSYTYFPGGFLWTEAGSNCSQCTKPPALNLPRKECCAVILPTGNILVVGDGASNTKIPELLDGGVWIQQPAEYSFRDHHAVLLLLPSGRVLSAGGNNRSMDFQVFEPPYIASGALRPTWVSPGISSMGFGQTLTQLPITLPPGTAVSKVVLIRPGSLTHHADMDQRYVQLTLVDHTTSWVTFKAPDAPPGGLGTVRAPRGYYMMFLVTNTGIPSIAQWIELQ